MPIGKSLSLLIAALLLAFIQACGISESDRQATHQAEYEATDTATPTATPRPTATATPTATGSADGPRPSVAGAIILNWTSGGHTPQLAFDGQGQLNLFFQASTSAGTHTINQVKMKADGTWTTPVVVSPEYQFFVSLTTISDTSGRLCVLWSGEQYDQSGNALDGLARNCQQADGTWQAQALPLANTTGSVAIAAMRAPDGTLQSIFVSQSKPAGLYYTPLAGSATKPLKGTLLSGSLQVLQGQIVIDTNGGYHVAWVETSGGADITIQHRFSLDSGKTWSPAEKLYSGSADNPADIHFQLLAGSAGQVHLAWDGDNAIHYRRWSAAGSWEAPITLSGTRRSSGVELVVGQDGLARAAWNMAASDSSIMLGRQLTDGTWRTPQAVSIGSALEMVLAVEKTGAIEMLWNEGDGLRYLTVPGP